MKLNCKGIKDLPRRNSKGVTHLRSKIQICLIDDKAQKPLVAKLRVHGYNVTKLDDLTRVSEVEEFPIVVTDIMGIGKSFGSDNEGWHVVRELRNQWPMKYILAYSAGNWDVSYSSYMEHLDGYLKKDALIEEWVVRLDAGVSATGDSVVYWKRCRDLLLKQGVSTEHVALLEDAFVRDVSSGKSKRMARLWAKLERQAEYAEIAPLLKPAMTMALGSLGVFADFTTLIPASP